jgi:hypothetical protein
LLLRSVEMISPGHEGEDEREAFLSGVMLSYESFSWRNFLSLMVQSRARMSMSVSMQTNAREQLFHTLRMWIVLLVYATVIVVHE